MLLGSQVTIGTPNESNVIPRTLNQFPLASPTDGLIDVTIQEITGRMRVLKAIDSGPTGQHYFLPFVCSTIALSGVQVFTEYLLDPLHEM
jgi:hypothetical protein